MKFTDRLQRDRSGIATILLVVIVVIVFVGAAGAAYVVLSNNNSNDNNDKDKDKEKDPVTGKIGMGSKFHYDLERGTVGAIATQTSIVCEVIGQDETRYFLSVPDVFFTEGAQLYTIMIEKSTGKISGATSKPDNVWTVTIKAEAGQYSYVDVTIEMKVGTYEFGYMVSSITFKSSGKQTIGASMNVGKSTVKAPTAYVPMPEAGKFCSYKMDMEISVSEGLSSMKVTAKGTIKTTILGAAKDGKYLILAETQMTVSVPGSSNISYSFSETYASDYTYEIPKDLPNAKPGTVVFKGSTVNVNVYEITETQGGVKVDMTMKIGVNKPILYSMEVTSNTIGANMTMTLVCTDTNF